MLQFATCDTNRALEFLKKLYPSKVEKCTWENLPQLKYLIGKDVLRVQDPDFYKPAQLTQGNKYNSEFDEEIEDAIQELKDVLHKDES